MDDFKLWLDARLGEVSQKSGLAEAIRYALSHWEGLTRFLSDGRIEIDSNTVERTMRPIGLGRLRLWWPKTPMSSRRLSTVRRHSVLTT